MVQEFNAFSSVIIRGYLYSLDTSTNVHFSTLYPDILSSSAKQM